jgi:hypothetical protein
MRRLEKIAKKLEKVAKTGPKKKYQNIYMDAQFESPKHVLHQTTFEASR